MTSLLAPARVRPMPALLIAARPAAVVLTAALSGALLVTWLAETSVAGSTRLWIEYHQAVTPAYTRALPPLGGLALVAALAALVASQGRRRDRGLILSAVLCLVVGLVVTVVVHFPINADIATWDPTIPPADWEQLRSRWLVAHAVRTAATVAAFALLVTGGLGHGRSAPEQRREGDGE